MDYRATWWLPDRAELNDRLELLWREGLEEQVVQWLLKVDLHGCCLKHELRAQGF